MGVFDAIGGVVSGAADLVGDVASGDFGGAIDDLGGLAGDALQLAGPMASIAVGGPMGLLAGGALGNLAGPLGSVFEVGSQAAGGLLGNVFGTLVDQADKISGGKKSTAGGASAEGGGILREIAQLMGGLAGDKLGELRDVAKGIGEGGGDGKDSNVIQQSLLAGAIGQEISALTKAAADAIQSIGQAETTGLGK